MAQNYCSKCGTNLAANANFCAACGQQVGQTQQVPPRHPAGNQQQQSAQAAPTPSFHYANNKGHSNIVTHQEKPEEQDAPTVEFQDLHPNARWLFFLSYAGSSSIILLLLAIGVMLMPLIFAVLFVVYFIALFVVANISYSNFKFEVSPHSFRKEYGVIHKRSASIPFDQIQNVNIKRNLIDRVFGLAHLEIETAGRSGGEKRGIIGGVKTNVEGYIPGIAPDEAQDLKDLMLTRALQS